MSADPKVTPISSAAVLSAATVPQSGGFLSSALASISSILQVGFGSLVVLLVVAGAIGFHALRSMSKEVRASFALVQEQSQLSSRLSSDIAQQLQAATVYLDTRDSATLAEFRALGWDAHATQRQMNARRGQSAQEVALTASLNALGYDLHTQVLADAHHPTHNCLTGTAAIDASYKLHVDLDQVGLKSGE